MPMKNPHVVWASVAIVVTLVAGVVVLAALGKDVVTLISLAGIVAVPVLSGFGAVLYQKLDQVQTQGNGRDSEQRKMIQDLNSQVAALSLKVQTPPQEKDDNSS